jgi:hypothetical protein
MSKHYDNHNRPPLGYVVVPEGGLFMKKKELFPWKLDEIAKKYRKGTKADE